MNDIKDGKYVEVDENNNIIKIVNFKNNKKNGEYKEWEKFVGSYSHGKHTNINSIGKVILTKCFYVDDKKEGEYTEWFDDEKIMTRCYYKNDKLEGEYKEWFDNGKLEIHSVYKDGELLEKKEWDEEGNLINMD